MTNVERFLSFPAGTDPGRSEVIHGLPRRSTSEGGVGYRFTVLRHSSFFRDGCSSHSDAFRVRVVREKEPQIDYPALAPPAPQRQNEEKKEPQITQITQIRRREGTRDDISSLPLFPSVRFLNRR